MMDPRCICMRLCARDLFTAWDTRAKPTLVRLVEHGHPIDTMRIIKIRKLCAALSRGDDDAFSAEHRGHSHHLPTCPCKGNRHAR